MRNFDLAIREDGSIATTSTRIPVMPLQRGDAIALREFLQKSDPAGNLTCHWEQIDKGLVFLPGQQAGPPVRLD